MSYAPAATVEGPPRLPLPYGLFSVVSLAETSTERWENGVNWETLSCDPVSIVIGDCNAPKGFPKQFPDAPDKGEADAFTVYGTYKCGPVGGWGDGLTHAQEMARRHLLAWEQRAAEMFLWSKLDDNPTVIAGGGPVKAIAELEEFIGDNYGSLGVIHASRRASTYLASQGMLIEGRGNQMFTKLGTPVVVGSGYPGTGASSTETQTLTKTGAPTAGNITLTYTDANGVAQTTGNIPWNASAAQVKTALDALTNLGTVSTAGGPLNTTAITITFDTNPGEDVNPLVVNGAFTGGGAAITTTVLGDVGATPTAGSEYIAASPALFGYRSDIFAPTSVPGDLLDRGQNDMYGIAERNYLIGYDPCGVAFIQMTLGT